MATAAVTFAGLRTPSVVNVPPDLVRLMGADKVRQYLARLTSEIRSLEAAGGQVLSFIDVHRGRQEDAVADVSTAAKRKL